MWNHCPAASTNTTPDRFPVRGFLLGVRRYIGNSRMEPGDAGMDVKTLSRTNAAYIAGLFTDRVGALTNMRSITVRHSTS